MEFDDQTLGEGRNLMFQVVGTMIEGILQNVSGNGCLSRSLVLFNGTHWETQRVKMMRFVVSAVSWFPLIMG